jgi:hypothetical protein
LTTEHAPVLMIGANPDQVFHFQQPHYGIIYSVVDGKVVVEHNNIESLKKYSLVIANLSSEHWGRGTIDMVYDLLEQHGITFIMLSHDINDHLARPKLFFYPHWYYQSLPTQLAQHRPTVIHDVCAYKVSCLNRAARSHRIYNWLLLREKSYFEHSLITMHHDLNTPPFGPENPVLDPQEIDQWNKLKIDLKDIFKHIPFNQAESIFDTTHPAYSNSYINLVTESVIFPTLFVTEKTWKPVVAGQLFLVIGSQNTIRYLRQCGVDTFDDIIDHDYYDNEPDWKTRVLRVHKLIDQLLEQDLSTVYQQTFVRRLANHTKYLNGEFGEPYKSLVTQQIPI